MRVHENRHGISFQCGPDRIQLGVVQTQAEPRGADDDAADERAGGGKALDFRCGVCGCGRGEGEAAECADAVQAGGADGVEFVVDFPGPAGRGVGWEEVQPGVREAEDGDGDVVRLHEREDVGDGGIGGRDWAAKVGGWGGGVGEGAIRGENDEAGCWSGRGGGGWIGVQELGWGGAGSEEGEVRWGIDVGVDVDDNGSGGRRHDVNWRSKGRR